MTATRLLATLLLALACAMTGADARQPPARSVALTFDDLPFVRQRGVYLEEARRTTAALLATLRRHQAPSVGFVNEVQLDTADRDARVALLRQWIDAGMVLGNHTYSHPDFNTVTIERFQEEIRRGERTIRQLQPALRPLYFRHPMTHTGNTREKKDAIDAFLGQLGYVIAPHTIENADFIFNAVYSRALAGKDAELAQRVKDAYLAHTFAATAFAERMSPAIFGREVPHTLLLHANELNAAALDALLQGYEQRGYRFITLDAAMADPAYATKDTLVSTHGPTWLWRWRAHLGITVTFTGDPEPPDWISKLYDAR